MFILDKDLRILGDVSLDQALTQVDLPVTRTNLADWEIDGRTIIVKYYARTESDPLRAPSQILEVPFEWSDGDEFELAGQAKHYPDPDGTYSPSR